MEKKLTMEYTITLDNLVRAFPNILRKIEDVFKVDIMNSLFNKLKKINVDELVKDATKSAQDIYNSVLEKVKLPQEKDVVDAINSVNLASINLYIGHWLRTPEAIIKTLVTVFDKCIEYLDKSDFGDDISFDFTMDWDDTRLTTQIEVNMGSDSIWYGISTDIMYTFEEAIEELIDLTEDNHLIYKLVNAAFPVYLKEKAMERIKDAIGVYLFDVGATNITVL